MCASREARYLFDFVDSLPTLLGRNAAGDDLQGDAVLPDEEAGGDAHHWVCLRVRVKVESDGGSLQGVLRHTATMIHAPRRCLHKQKKIRLFRISLLLSWEEFHPHSVSLSQYAIAAFTHFVDNINYSDMQHFAVSK